MTAAKTWSFLETAKTSSNRHLRAAASTGAGQSLAVFEERTFAGRRSEFQNPVKR